MKFYNRSSDDVIKELDVNYAKGLTNAEIEGRRKKYGVNEFTVKEEGGMLKDIP